MTTPMIITLRNDLKNVLNEKQLKKVVKTIFKTDFFEAIENCDLDYDETYGMIKYLQRNIWKSNKILNKMINEKVDLLKAEEILNDVLARTDERFIIEYLNEILDRETLINVMKKVLLSDFVKTAEYCDLTYEKAYYTIKELKDDIFKAKQKLEKELK